MLARLSFVLSPALNQFEATWSWRKVDAIGVKHRGQIGRGAPQISHRSTKSEALTYRVSARFLKGLVHCRCDRLSRLHEDRATDFCPNHPQPLADLAPVWKIAALRIRVVETSRSWIGPVNKWGAILRGCPDLLRGARQTRLATCLVSTRRYAGCFMRR